MSVTDVEHHPARVARRTTRPAGSMKETAEVVTRLVHGGGPAAAGGLLARLSQEGLKDLVVALAAARRPKWTRADDNTVDEIAVKRAVAGEPVQLTRPEREAAARIIISLGGGPSALGRRLHLSGTTAGKLYELITEPQDEAARAVIASGGTVTALAEQLNIDWAAAYVVYNRVAGNHPGRRGPDAADRGSR